MREDPNQTLPLQLRRNRRKHCLRPSAPWNFGASLWGGGTVPSGWLSTGSGGQGLGTALPLRLTPSSPALPRPLCPSGPGAYDVSAPPGGPAYSMTGRYTAPAWSEPPEGPGPAEYSTSETTRTGTSWAFISTSTH